MKTATRRTFLETAGVVAAAAAGLAPARADGPKRKTIVLQSAWDTVNIGDIGHTPGTLRILERHLPDVRVIVWAMKLDERVSAMLKARFPKAEFLQGSLTGTGQRDERLRDAVRGCDLFVRNSGMGQDTGYMEFCRKAGKPYGLYGQSYFPDMVEGKGGAERKALLDAAAFVYCRESKTLDILRRAGVKPPVLDFGPDGCFGIDVRDEPRGLATMKRLGLEDRKFLTIQLRTNTAKLPGVDDRRTPKLNPLHPTPEQVADDERRAAVYRDLITRWVRRTGYKVLIAPEVRKEMAHNKRLLHDPLPAEVRGHVVGLDEFWNCDEAASVFARGTRPCATSRTRSSSRWPTARRSCTRIPSSTARNAGCSRTSAWASGCWSSTPRPPRGWRRRSSPSTTTTRPRWRKCARRWNSSGRNRRSRWRWWRG